MRKAVSCALFLLIALDVSSSGCFAAFSAETLVHVSEKEYKPIVRLMCGDKVVSPLMVSREQAYPITKTYKYTVSNAFRIKINGINFYTTRSQRFYSAAMHSWIPAYKLSVGDALLCDDGSAVFVDEIEKIARSILVYALTVDKAHNFCVGPDGIIAHNISEAQIAGLIASEELIATPIANAATMFFPGANQALTIAKVVVYVAKAIFTGVVAYFAVKSNQKRKHDRPTFAQIQAEIKEAACSGGSPRDPNEDKKNDYKNHPHGAYHDGDSHVKRRPRKSPPPKDGQRCLDYSVNYGEAKQRIGIEGDTFIMFQPTSERLYHGYVVEWNEIKRPVQIWFQEHQYASSSGRILKQITQTINERIIF